MTDKIMMILQADEKAKSMLAKFEKAAEGANMVGEEYQEARKTMIMLIIAKVPAALEIMANEIWEEVNA